ncbi:MAG: hypothetical protein Fur0018_09220 [Anaerolineales bacterium]
MTHMQTPAGKTCPHFYGDYHRGRQHEECRLLEEHRQPWQPSLCETCPVPDILQANACPNLRLRPQVRRDLLPWRKRVVLTAYCTKSQQEVAEPHIGCGQCHDLPASFRLFMDE